MKTKQPTPISFWGIYALAPCGLLFLSAPSLIGKELANVIVTLSSEGFATIGNYTSDPLLISGRTDGGGFWYSYSADKYIGSIIEGGWESFFAWDWCGTGRSYGTREIPSGEIYEFPEPYHLAKGKVRITFSYRQKDEDYNVSYFLENGYGPEILTRTEAPIREKEEAERKAAALIKDTENFLKILHQIVEIRDLERRKERIINFIKVINEPPFLSLDEVKRLAEGELDLTQNLLKQGYKQFPSTTHPAR